MHSNVKIVKVFIGGPSDTKEYRRSVVNYIRNVLYKDYPALRIDPFTWDDERNPISIPWKGEPQDTINAEFDPKTSNIVIIIFKWLLGKPTIIGGKEYPSGSAFELEETAKSSVVHNWALYKYSEVFPNVAPLGNTHEEHIALYEEYNKNKKQFETLNRYFSGLHNRLGFDDAEEVHKRTNSFDDSNFLLVQISNFLKTQLANISEAPSPKRVPLNHGNPYRGLYEFDEAHKDFFFGREDEISRLLIRFQSQDSPRLLMIYGASGVGKSSLLKAGLLPALANNSQTQDWKFLIFEPKGLTGNPFQQLAAAVKFHDSKLGLIAQSDEKLALTICEICSGGQHSGALSDSNADLTDLAKVLEELLAEPLLADFPENAELVLVINQFEELLTCSPILKEIFFRLIASTTVSTRIRVFCTLRMDAMHEIMSSEGLKEAFTPPDKATFWLYPPMRHQLEDMIVEPGRKVGVKIERALVTRMLDDAMKTRDGALPLVGYTLETLYAKYGTNIVLKHYTEDLKGISGAVEQLAAKVTENIPKYQLYLLFEKLALIHNGSWSRKKALRVDLDKLGIDSTLINKLTSREARLLQAVEHELKPCVQLAHEILFQAWPALKEWTKESEAKLRMLDEIVHDAEYWRNYGERLRHVKLRDEQLEDVIKMLHDDSAITHDHPVLIPYVQAAKKQQVRETLVRSINGGHISGLVGALAEGGRLEIEDRNDQPGGVRPQFWAAVTGDDSPTPGPDRKSSSALRPQDKKAPSIFDDAKLINSKVTRGISVLDLVAASGHLDLLKRLVEKCPAALNNTSEIGGNLVTSAALGGHVEIVRFLVETCKLDANIVDSSGATPLFWAFQRNHKDVVAYLQKHGGDLDLRIVNGWNKLTEAARTGDVEVVRSLLEEGDVYPDYSTDNGFTPLMVACQYGSYSVAKLLLENKALPDKQDSYGFTALHYACISRENKNTSIIDLLIENGANKNKIDNEGFTPLTLAALNGNHSHVKTLLTHNADFRLSDKDGFCPLFAAATNGYYHTVQVLLNAGDDVNKSWKGWAPIHYACEDGDMETSKVIVDYHVAHGISLDTLGPNSMTPLMLATKRGHTHIIKLLVGANVNRRPVNREGTDALALAIQSGNISSVRELIANELQLAPCFRNNTPSFEENQYGGNSTMSMLHADSTNVLPNYPNRDHLSLSVAVGDPEIVQILIQAGADPRKTDTLGDTALHHAARFGLDNITELLLKHDIPFDALDRDGFTPIEIADKNRNNSVVTLLESKGACIPSDWDKPSISEQTKFLSFENVTKQDERWIRTQLITQESLAIPLDQSSLRIARLPFYDGGGVLVAINDPKRRGKREQFALAKLGQELFMMDWTNVSIYAANEQWSISLDDDNNVMDYTRFFFFFVRGKLGAFNIIENIENIPWREDATSEIKDKVNNLIMPLQVVDRTEQNLIRLRMTLLFKNALFRTDCLIATHSFTIEDDEDKMVLERGNTALRNEVILLEDLPVIVDQPQNAF